MKQLPYEIKLIYIIVILVMIFFVGFIIFVVLMYNRKQILYIKEKQLKDAEYKNQLLEKELEKQKSIQKERQRISHDMHDEIGAGISAIKLQSEILKQQRNQAIIDDKEIDELIKISDNMNIAMREMLWSLNSDNDAFDNFVDYCFQYLENYFSKTKINFHFKKNAENEKRLITSEVRRNLLLIIKEASHNIVKHSQSTDAYFEIIEKSEKLLVLIKDNGKGFVSDSNSLGYGLYSMQSRAKSIGGELSINSDLTGTIIEINIFM